MRLRCVGGNALALLGLMAPWVRINILQSLSTIEVAVNGRWWGDSMLRSEFGRMRAPGTQLSMGACAGEPKRDHESFNYIMLYIFSAMYSL